MYLLSMHLQANWKTVDPDQMALSVAADLDQHSVLPTEYHIARADLFKK